MSEDLHIINEGTIFLVWPITDSGRQWLRGHVDQQAMKWGPCTVVEHRYIADLVDGAREDGLVVV